MGYLEHRKYGEFKKGRNPPEALKNIAKAFYFLMFLEFSLGHYTQQTGLVAGTAVRVVMLLLCLLSSLSLDFFYKICAVLQWLASKMIFPDGEGASSLQAPQAAPGSTSKRWLKEPEQWLYTTPYLLSKTSSLSTGLSSSSARIT